MKNFISGKICLMVLILSSYNTKSEGAPSYSTTTKVYTTRPTPSVEIDQTSSWMSPPRVEHQSKSVESVIFEPQPRIMLSRSTYKVTSFIDFMPYREAFKKFETFFRKFKNNINDPDHVGPLINVNTTKGESWKGPKEAFFRVRCKKNAYKCRLARQFKLVRMETNRIAKVFYAIYTKFISAIDSMENHPTSGKSGKKQRTRVKRDIDPSFQKKDISEDDIIMIKQIRQMIEVNMLGKNYTSPRKKRFIVAASILGWKIHENKKEIEKLKGAVTTLYHQNKLQQDQILETARFLNITYGYVTENRMSINELQVKLAIINHTLIETMSEIKFVKYTIAILTDARSALA